MVGCMCLINFILLLRRMYLLLLYWSDLRKKEGVSYRLDYLLSKGCYLSFGGNEVRHGVYVIVIVYRFGVGDFITSKKCFRFNCY